MGSKFNAAQWAFTCPRENMAQSTVELAFSILEKVVYLAMLILGIYFTYEGDVIQR